MESPFSEITVSDIFSDSVSLVTSSISLGMGFAGIVAVRVAMPAIKALADQISAGSSEQTKDNTSAGVIFDLALLLLVI